MPATNGENGEVPKRKNFIKVVEDFECEKCGQLVSGSGYTDHCPRCLWGKHVDIVPGDRASKCRGALVPIAALYEKGGYKVEYKCEKCGAEKKFKAAAGDDQDELFRLAGKNLVE
ncbi:MAG: RNHCP domain-containing protein [Candidatus Micrarchaeota archaeon]|nr:RNHCP domain-containing protein [Candidatus Micrarchaeota archaeon]MDE1848387.1 RNHCP domain-containing protein [Candidatus Micrarchaeota archaeon]MDE1864303.1 RNHCP domain-containing protein [Candidatus Micrarchaeota archaeon]